MRRQHQLQDIIRHLSRRLLSQRKSAQPNVVIEEFKGTLHSVEKTLIQKAYCVYYYILKERRFFDVD